MTTSNDIDKPWILPEGSGRGIFTDSDREFFQKSPEEREADYHRSTRIQHWHDARDRLQYGIIDLKNCLYYLPKRTRGEAFEGLFMDKMMFTPFQVITEGIGFLLLGLLEERDKNLDDEEYLEQAVKRSIDRMLWGSDQRIAGNTGEIEVNISIKGWQDQDHYLRHMDPEDLNEEQLHGMYVMGELTQEEFAKAVLADSSEGD